MDIEKKNSGFSKILYSINKIPPDLRGYYKRYLYALNLEPVQMDRVESFSALKEWSGGQVLDIGCGLGYLTHYLEACGVDKNKEVISLAKDLYPRSDFYVWDNTCNFADESFDTIICYNLIEHLTENERMDLFKKINKMLKKDGKIIFGYADPYNQLQLLKGFFSKSALFDPTHIYNWTVKQFQQIIARAFNVLEIKKTSPFARYIWFGKYFKGEILMCCSSKEK